MVELFNYSIATKRRKNSFSLFEFGSGHSTLFLANIFKSVTSVEHDKTWFQYLKQKVPENVELIYCDDGDAIDGEYCQLIHATGRKYDVVIIDGKDRANCFKQSIKALSEIGVVVVDDADRVLDAEITQVSISNGFRSLEFSGLKPLRNGTYAGIIF